MRRAYFLSVLAVVAVIWSASMFDIDDQDKMQAGLDFLSALRHSSWQSRRTTLATDDDYWETLDDDALDLVLWSAAPPGNRKGNNTNRDRNVRPRLDWVDHVAQLNKLGLFRRYYRMSEAYLESLYELMHDDLQTNKIKACNSTKQCPVSAWVALSATLRYLAVGFLCWENILGFLWRPVQGSGWQRPAAIEDPGPVGNALFNRHGLASLAGRSW